MAVTPAVLQGGVLLTTSSAIIYTCPAATRAVIKRAVFSNVTGSAVTLTLTSTRSGGGALGVITVQAIPANSTYTAPELANWTMVAGDALNALCSAAASVNAYASGFTVV